MITITQTYTLPRTTSQKAGVQKDAVEAVAYDAGGTLAELGLTQFSSATALVGNDVVRTLVFHSTPAFDEAYPNPEDQLAVMANRFTLIFESKCFTSGRVASTTVLS